MLANALLSGRKAGAVPQTAVDLESAVGEELGLLAEQSIGPAFQLKTTVPDQFLSQATGRADAVACLVAKRDGDPGGGLVELTYAQLAAGASAIARDMRALGVQPDDRVCLVLHRGLHQLLSVYATLLAGAAFVPVAADSPEERLRDLLEDSSPRLVLREESMADIFARLSDSFASGGAASPQVLGCPQSDAHVVQSDAHVVQRYPGEELRHAAVLLEGSSVRLSLDGAAHEPGGQLPQDTLEQHAIVFYTSGSTGKPKGVVYSHAHLAHGVATFVKDTCTTAESVGLVKTPYVWATTEWEMFPTLLSGGRLAIVGRDDHKDPMKLAQWIAEAKVSVLSCTPGVLSLLVDLHSVGGQLNTLTAVWCSGEALPTALANRCMSTAGLTFELFNSYGATESSTTVYKVPRQGIDPAAFPHRAPGGWPQPGASVWVMCGGARQQQGEVGEIVFGGQLSVGYHNRPEATAEKFQEVDGFGFVYRTGDLGRWTSSGLEVMGRADRQVKVNGVRVEPEEVEAVLSSFETAAGHKVRQRAVVKVEAGSQELLVALVAPELGEEEVLALRRHCKDRLPPYYLPSHVISFDQLKTLPNGKIDLMACKTLASERVGDQVQVVSSLGQMQMVTRHMAAEVEILNTVRAVSMFSLIVYHWFFMPNLADWETLQMKDDVADKLGAFWLSQLIRVVSGLSFWSMHLFAISSGIQDSAQRSNSISAQLKGDVFTLLLYLACQQLLPAMLGGFYHLVLRNPPDQLIATGSRHSWYLVAVLICRLAHFLLLRPLSALAEKSRYPRLAASAAWAACVGASAAAFGVGAPTPRLPSWLRSMALNDWSCELMDQWYWDLTLMVLVSYTCAWWRGRQAVAWLMSRPLPGVWAGMTLVAFSAIAACVCVMDAKGRLTWHLSPQGWQVALDAAFASLVLSGTVFAHRAGLRSAACARMGQSALGAYLLHSWFWGFDGHVHGWDLIAFSFRGHLFVPTTSQALGFATYLGLVPGLAEMCVVVIYPLLFMAVCAPPFQSAITSTWLWVCTTFARMPYKWIAN